ncbi:MAG: hypothetical protein M1269_12480 [Chloroflexi bacterium]|nr:hypothetical protein [Chloroflexota bacterium]
MRLINLHRMQGSFRNPYKRLICCILLLSIFLSASAGLSFSDGSLPYQPGITLDHLNSLKKIIHTDDASLSCWAIYCERQGDGSYKPAGAPGEGFSCVDDVARAAMVYILDAELTGSGESIENAKEALEFLLYMQTSDGLFYNFIHENGAINKTGETSAPGLNWWYARGYLGLASGLNFFKKRNTPLYRRLIKACNKSFSAIERHVNSSNGGPVPPGNAADVSSLILLALCEHYKIQPSDEIKKTALKLGDVLSKNVSGSYKSPLYGVRPTDLGAPWVWHSYGSHTVEALAKGGKVFKRPGWVSSAENEVLSFYSHLLVNGGPVNGFYPEPRIFPQIAYGCECLISGGIETGGPASSFLPVFYSWFTGNNPAGKPAVSFETGRAYDGIDAGGINLNAGAESTIEWLLASLRLEKSAPGAIRKASVVLPVKSCGFEFVALPDGSGYSGDKIEGGFSLEKPGPFKVYITAVPQDSGPLTFQIDARDAFTISSLNDPSGFHVVPGEINIPPGEHRFAVSGEAVSSISGILFQPVIEYKFWETGSGEDKAVFFVGRNFGDTEGFIDLSGLETSGGKYYSYDFKKSKWSVAKPISSEKLILKPYNIVLGSLEARHSFLLSKGDRFFLKKRIDSKWVNFYSGWIK